MGDALDAAGVPHRVQRAESLFSVFFGESVCDGVEDYAGALGQHVAAHTAFFHAKLEGGVSLPPSAFEAWFVSAAHNDAALGRFFDALPAGAGAAARAV